MASTYRDRPWLRLYQPGARGRRLCDRRPDRLPVSVRFPHDQRKLRDRDNDRSRVRHTAIFARETPATSS